MALAAVVTPLHLSVSKHLTKWYIFLLFTFPSVCMPADAQVYRQGSTVHSQQVELQSEYLSTTNLLQAHNSSGLAVACRRR